MGKSVPKENSASKAFHKNLYCATHSPIASIKMQEGLFLGDAYSIVRCEMHA